MGKKILILIALSIVYMSGSLTQGFDNFITISGNKLIDGDKEFRFLSYNIPNLNYVEDEMSFTSTTPYRLPTEFELRDAFLSIKQMGGRVIRLYTIPVKLKEQPDNCPAHVLAPGKFNEEAFKINDLMLALANEYGIRLIFPIVNNWKWMGGRPQYAEFRGKTEDEFWTDPQVIEDVKETIKYTLNRTNTITGIKYKNDKSILCWETGNELVSPFSWIVIMTRYMKEQDTNHLVMDGFYAINNIPVIQKCITEPSIDILSSHHYETDPIETLNNIKQNLNIINGRKAYIIGEFGFQSTTAIKNIMEFMISDHEIAGGLIWSLRHHREEGGFYWHTEPMGMGIYKAYHWPGFPSGHIYDETNFIRMMRDKSFEIQETNTPAMDKPLTPGLLPITDVFDINWKGSVGASYYIIERAEDINVTWKVIEDDINDADIQYSSLWYDESAKIGKTYFYRIRAGNSAGISDPSISFGPVKVMRQAIVDNMTNYSVFYNYDKVICKTGDDRKFKEDMHRMEGVKKSEILYLVPGKPVSIKIYSYEKAEKPVLSLKTSENGTDFMDLKSKSLSYSESRNDYGYWKPVMYESESINPLCRYIKIIFKDIAQISKIVIIYE